MTGGAAVKLPDMAYELMETGYHAMLNYQHRDWGRGFSTVILQIEPKHLNLAGVLHGGVLSGLLDIVCAQSGIYFPDEQVIRRSVTLSLTTTFTGQCSEGLITACGKVRAQGRRIRLPGELRHNEARRTPATATPAARSPLSPERGARTRARESERA